MLDGSIVAPSCLVFHLPCEIAPDPAFHKWIPLGQPTASDTFQLYEFGRLSFHLISLFMSFTFADCDGEQITTGIQPSRDVRLRCVSSRLRSILD